MDFYSIRVRAKKNGSQEVYPEFLVAPSKDLLVRGGAFYAVWDEEKGLWSTNELDISRIVDRELYDFAKQVPSPDIVSVDSMGSFSSGVWKTYRNYVTTLPSTPIQLDGKLTFKNTPTRREDYASKRLPYSLEDGDYSAYDRLMSVLYSPEEREKLEWAIGAIISGDARKIQKFIVLYGEAGTGKSTVLNIIQKLFQGYYVPFEAKALTSSSNAFATEIFKSNPLVAIQHDGDLSRIEDNTKLNSIVSHEEIVINEKFKAAYASRINCFLFMGTNKPVKITDAKSGVIRRLIDVRPTGNLFSPQEYNELYSAIDFELGAIAKHCLDVYLALGKNYYNTYKPVEMMFQTDVFFNFVEENYDVFSRQDYVTLDQAYAMYKTYCDDSLVEYKLARYKFRDELKNYFAEYYDRGYIDGQRVRSYYVGFLQDKFTSGVYSTPQAVPIELSHTESIFDQLCADYPAQYANDKGTPERKWSEVTTTLKDLDTRRLHFVKLPKDHIVVDLDIRDSNGEKSSELNLAKASEFPRTYAEFSKSGGGVHLHYIYQGDVDELASSYSDGVEIKVFKGNSSLRRKLSYCSGDAIGTISSGLPVKEVKQVINKEFVANEQAIRTMIMKNLRKEYHSHTAPSVDYIRKILDDAYNAGTIYDVTDMRPKIVAFAARSTNQASRCLAEVTKMRFKSEDEGDEIPFEEKQSPIVFFDIEVFPNLFVICWKKQGSPNIVKMINPEPKDIEDLFKLKLVGFNNRRYDNHILYARYIGYSNEELYQLSQRIINSKTSDYMFREAYNISYTDIYDFSSKKQSLKKFEIDLGIHHQELDIPWDAHVPDNMIDKVVTYCCYDVEATEAVFNARQSDYTARLILSELSGLSPNNTTQQHTAKIVFEGNKNPQNEFVYTDLSKEFEGYKYEAGKSSYLDVDVIGEGGYVYAEPGIYENVVVFDVASMHPTSIEVLNCFGKYTKNFSNLKKARIAIKHKDLKSLESMFDGKLMKYVGDDKALSELSYALKIAINIVYGLTSASFPNPFRDPRNVDNIVAKRGALFMIRLRNELQRRGVQVIHIKTDSIKVSNPSEDITQFILDFGKIYGYDFEVENIYSRMALVNKAVYIAQHDDGKWDATGAQFAHPYVFKKLFSHEEIEFSDLCETKAVSGNAAMYLCDFCNGEPTSKHFVGRVGSFCPVTEDIGRNLMVQRDGKLDAVSGTIGYYWMESETVRLCEVESGIDMSYFDNLCDKAIATLAEVGDPNFILG